LKSNEAEIETIFTLTIEELSDKSKWLIDTGHSNPRWKSKQGEHFDVWGLTGYVSYKLLFDIILPSVRND